MKLLRSRFLPTQRTFLRIFAIGCCCNLLYALPSPAIAQKPALASVQPPTTLDPPAFAAGLRKLEAKLLGGNTTTAEIDSVVRSLPPSWKVETPQRQYEISSAPLRDLLERALRDSTHRDEILDQAGNWIEDAATQTEGYVQAEDATTSSMSDARSKLQQILKRREFSPAGPPTAWQLLRQRIGEWLQQMFTKVFRSIARHPVGSELLFWLIIFGGVCWIVTMLVRLWSGRGSNISLRPIATIAAHRSWQQWIRTAQDAAARGEFREAIHALYWTGITRLEDLAVLTVDHTRTPREQLRQLSAPPASPGSPAIAQATAVQRSGLAALTTQLESVWYGRRPASNEDFRECMKSVEELGCRLT